MSALVTDRARLVALAESIHAPRDLAFDVHECGDRHWNVAIGVGDSRGALAIVVGLFTAHRLSVASAEISTVVSSDDNVTERKRSSRRRAVAVASRPPARLLVGVFDVHGLAEPSPNLWETFQTDLTATLFAASPDAAKDELIGRVSEAIHPVSSNPAMLLPLEIGVTNEPDAPSTMLRVRSPDTPGFLFALANALAEFTINIERASIRTVDDDAEDSFWVTDVRRRPIVDQRSIHELRVVATLVEQFTYLLPRSPNPGQALRQFNALIRQMLARPEWSREIASLESPAVLETLANLLGVSRFLWEDFLRMQHESLFPLVVDAPALVRPATRAELLKHLDHRLADASGHDERVEALNRFKDREMFRIDLRHIVGESGFFTFSRELTDLAEVALDRACILAIDELIPKFGRALIRDGRECRWCVCALGKFGGGELGFGSDLELIFVYEDEGQTDGTRSIVNGEYFIYVVQTLLRTLRARQEGIFEIDLRLRPFGRAGGLASSLAGFAIYYSDAGSAAQFERLALVRLRPVSGDANLVAAVQRLRDTFVYSGQPLDLANVRHLRQRQATELVPRGEVNAKYSAGGLVDLEYFAQVWQIAAGAVDPRVRVTNTLEAIERLAAGGYVDVDLAHELKLTHLFLRQLIEGLRVVRGNAKDLSIPAAESRQFAYLARWLRFPSPSALRAEIDARMSSARELWRESAPLPH